MTASIKTAISINSELFEKVNRISKDLNISRSKLFTMAVQDLINKKEAKDLLSRINHAFNDHPDPEELNIQRKMKKKHIENIEIEQW